MARNTYKQDELLEEPFDIKHILRASGYIKKHAGKMAVAFTISAIGGITGLVSPILFKKALDVAIPNGDRTMLFALAGAMAFFYILSILFATIRSYLMINVSQDIIYSIRTICAYDSII